MLEQRISKYLLPKVISVNDSLFTDEDAKNAFVKETLLLLERARLFRNAEAHPDGSQLEEYREEMKINALANEIAAWREKYEKILAG